MLKSYIGAGDTVTAVFLMMLLAELGNGSIDNLADVAAAAFRVGLAAGSASCLRSDGGGIFRHSILIDIAQEIACTRHETGPHAVERKRE